MKYTLQFKTGDAEIRALKNIPEEIFSLADFRLLIEITRGRKSKKDTLGILQKRIDSLNSFLSPNTNVFFDVTSDPNLGNEQIDALYDIKDGYNNWRNFFNQLYHDYVNATPMLVINDEDAEYANFSRQISLFSERYHRIGYKIYPNIDVDTIRRELRIIKDTVSPDTHVFIFYDQGYIVDGLIKFAENKAVEYLGVASAIFETHANVEYIFTSTSFPDSVTSLSGTMDGNINCAEITLFDCVANATQNIALSYSDYGSITPKRNDDVAFYSNGWTPRIDVPASNNLIFYYRQKRENRDYADVYVDVANRCMADRRFPKDLTCWGCDTIKGTASGLKPGATPSFWISVRMNIYIYQRLRKLSII